VQAREVVCVVQRIRKRRSTSAAGALTSSSVKNTAKVKVKVEPEALDPEVTCSADDVMRQSSAAEVIKCESCEDALLPDTTTDNVNDVTDAASTCQSVSNRIVDAVTAGAVPQLQQQAVPARSDIGPSCQHQYVHYIHQAAPEYNRDEPALFAAGREFHQPYYDDIDDVLSVMASVAGVTQPYHPHLSNY